MTDYYKVVSTAREWIGTRFFHQGRRKKSVQSQGACDCLGLIMGVAQELNLNTNLQDNNKRIPLHAFDSTEYSKVPNGNKIYKRISSILTEVDIKDMQIGDLLLLKIKNNPQHLAILSDYGELYGIIHTWQDAGQVLEHSLSDYWYKKIFSVFRFEN